MTLLRFSVVTVLYNSNAVLPQMLASIPAGHEVILIDNGAIPPPQEMLGPGVRYMASTSNIGFGRACNAGAAVAGGDWILFLNPDAVLRPGFFEALAEAAAAHPACGVFVATTWQRGKLYAPDTSWIESAATGKKVAKASFAQITGDRPVRFANGGAFAIRASLFRQTGGFDEAIFLYYEDDDLSWRLLQAGEPMIQVYAAGVDHVLGTSTPPSAALSELRGYAKERSVIYLSGKYSLPGNGIAATARIAANLLFYGLTFNRKRFFTQLGRLKARLGVALRS